ncbi:DUF488 domain-containing protein [Phycisphaeraceae bacterium D3-23]
MPKFQAKRVYEPKADTDGLRILVDRVWPRGVSKDQAAIDAWAKDLAPSTKLRKWFAHDPEKYPAFKERYHDELDVLAETVTQYVNDWADHGTVTLVYSAKDEQHNQAVVLRDYLTHRATQ